jgi:Rrf2 family transcriptional regulator, cysteine metabolism repressor
VRFAFALRCAVSGAYNLYWNIGDCPVHAMNISVKGQYALQAIFDLASQPAGEPVRIADIARRQKIPQKFLELILAGLKQGGFVESRRGAEGGYLLARTPDAITVGEVLRFVEGPQQSKSRANKKIDSAFGDMWQQVDRAISGVIDKTTFADLLRAWNEKQNRYVLNWEI